MQTKVHIPQQYACSHVVVVAICHASRVGSQYHHRPGMLAALGTLVEWPGWELSHPMEKEVNFHVW